MGTTAYVRRRMLMGEARRARVAQLLSAGKTRRQICEELHCSESTLSVDIRQLVQDWRASALDLVGEGQLLDLKRADALLRVTFPKALAGDPDSIDRTLRIMKFRFEILGYDKMPDPRGNGPTTRVTMVQVEVPYVDGRFDLSKQSEIVDKGSTISNTDGGNNVGE